MSPPPPDDDDRTVHQPRTVPLSSGSVHTPVTTPRQTQGVAGVAAHHSLPLGTRLAEFELTKEIGEGGFSIVYLAWDHSLERKVALKEYMPSSIAARSGPTEVGARSERHRETFDAGLKSFINEAKLLARFDHPALVKVYRFWEANGTAYMVMPFYEGKTVKDTVRALPAPPDEAWLLGLLGPLTEALNVIHAERCYHRDIAPDNVILLAGSGKPLLLDFGAARRVIGDMTQALTVILKPGYAPVEQYAEVPGMKQGPWTDVYALAAVVYWAITGRTPPASVGRMLNDTYVPLLECAAGRYEPQFLRSIDGALIVLPERRTQTIDAFRQAVGLGAGPLDAQAPDVRQADPEATVIRPPLSLPHVQAPAVEQRRTATQAVAAQAPSEATLPVPRLAAASKVSRRSALIGVATVATVALTLTAWWALKSPSIKPAAPPPVAEETSRAPVPSAAAPAPDATVRKALAPRSPAEAFASVAAASDGAIQVTARTDSKTLTAGRDKLQVTVQASESGYVQVFGYRVGTAELAYLHPTRLDDQAAIQAKVPMHITLPGSAAAPPLPASWRVLVIVSRQPRDLRAAGWQSRGNEYIRGFADTAAATDPFWGTSVCRAGTSMCGDAFGAVDLALDVAANDLPARDASGGTGARRTDAPDAKADRPRKEPGSAAPRARAVSSDNHAECQRILQRQSLGETGPELIERSNVLGCR